MKCLCGHRDYAHHQTRPGSDVYECVDCDCANYREDDRDATIARLREVVGRMREAVRAYIDSDDDDRVEEFEAMVAALAEAEKVTT